MHISKCSHPNPCVFSDISRIQTALHCSHCSQAPDTCHLSFALLPLLPHSPRLPLFFLSSCPSRTARRSLLKCKTCLSHLKPFLQSRISGPEQEMSLHTERCCSQRWNPVKKQTPSQGRPCPGRRSRDGLQGWAPGVGPRGGPQGWAETGAAG